MNVPSLPNGSKNLAQLRLEEYRDIQVNDPIKYMWAEDWHEKRYPEFVAFNNKADELQRGNSLDVCPEFMDYVQFTL